MSERSIKAYDYYKDLQQRAEYLLVGLLAASIAFFWQNSKSEQLGFSPGTLHLLGLAFLFLALVAAITRLDRHPLIYALNADLLDLEGERSSMVQSISQGKTVVSGTRGVMDPLRQHGRIQEIDRETGAIRSNMDKINTECARFYRVRNFSMCIGYLVLLGHRIWLPYS